NLAVIHRAEHDRRRLQAILQLVHRLAQDLGVGAFDGHGEDLRALDIDRLVGEIRSLPRNQPRLQLGDFLFERPFLLQQVVHGGLHAAGLRAQALRDLVELLQLVVQHAERVLAGRGLDAADARSHAALRIDLEKTDVYGALAVRAAAELARSGAI